MTRTERKEEEKKEREKRLSIGPKSNERKGGRERGFL